MLALMSQLGQATSATWLIDIHLTWFYLTIAQVDHQGPWASCLNFNLKKYIKIFCSPVRKENV